MRTQGPSRFRFSPEGFLFRSSVQVFARTTAQVVDCPWNDGACRPQGCTTYVAACGQHDARRMY